MGEELRRGGEGAKLICRTILTIIAIEAGSSRKVLIADSASSYSATEIWPSSISTRKRVTSK